VAAIVALVVIAINTSHHPSHIRLIQSDKLEVQVMGDEFEGAGREASSFHRTGSV